MAQPLYSHNHLVSPTTGFLENPAYPDAFDSARKLEFLERLKVTPYRMQMICRNMRLDWHTLQKHMEMDATFRKSVQTIKGEVTEEIEQHLVDNARTSDMPAWTIFALKCLKPEVYNPVVKSQQDINVTVDIHGLDNAIEGQQTLEAEVIQPMLTESARTVDSDGVLKIESE